RAGSIHAEPVKFFSTERRNSSMSARVATLAMVALVGAFGLALAKPPDLPIVKKATCRPAEEAPVTRVYPVADLVVPFGNNQTPSTADLPQLPQLVPAPTAPAPVPMPRSPEKV